jgi:transposase
MLSFSGSLRIFVAVETCDMRKGFDGLSAVVGSVLKEEVKSGAPSLFSNRRHTRLKILFWNRAAYGFEQTAGKGTFGRPKLGDGAEGNLPLRAEALSMLMDPAADRSSLPPRGKLAPQPGKSKATRRRAHKPESSDLSAPAPRLVLFKKSRRYLPRSAFG